MFVFVGVPGVSSTDTNNPLFLGGHPYPQRIGNTDRQKPYYGMTKRQTDKHSDRQ